MSVSLLYACDMMIVVDQLDQRMDFESALHTKRHLEILQQFRHLKADISCLDEQVNKHEQALQK